MRFDSTKEAIASAIDLPDEERTYTKLADNDSHDIEDLGISGSRDITCVIAQDGIEKTRYQINIDTI